MPIIWNCILIKSTYVYEYNIKLNYILKDYLNYLIIY